MKNAVIMCLVMAALARVGLAQPRQERGRRPLPAAVSQEIREEQDKAKKFKTGEGEIDRNQWTEYTVNPTAKGACTLVIVLGGRDSLGSSAMPDELPTLITYAKTQVKGKVVFVVPKPKGGAVGGRMMRGGAAFGGENAMRLTNLPKLVRRFVEKHNVDKARVLATGVSMGGHQLLGLLNDDPGLIAKAMVVSAAGDTSALADVRTSVRMIHGEDDDAIPLFKAQATVEAINKANPNQASLVTLKGKDHTGAMKEAFGKKENLKWLFN